MLFGIQYLAQQPEYQQSCFDEILRLRDEGTDVSLLNQHRYGLLWLPTNTYIANEFIFRFNFMQATIYEIFRLSSLTASVIPHRVTQDTTLHGFDIPKDTLVLTNNIGNNMNPKYFEDPENFNPKRFLDSNGKCSMGSVLVSALQFDFVTIMKL